MFTENRFKRFSTLLVLTLFSSTLACRQAVFANDIPKGTKALIQVDNTYIGKKLKYDSRINATLVNDIKVNGKTIIKAGEPAFLNVADAESSHFAGNPGIIKLENGKVISNNIRYMFNFNETIYGKDKEWVRITTTSGVFLFPLFLFGLVKGGQAEIPANKVYEVEFSGYSYSMKNL